LTKAIGNEEFLPLGSDENMPPYEGEIVYKDDAGAICRCWNWREAQRTMLTENTKNAFLCVELVDETREEDFVSAIKELADIVPKHIGGTVKLYILDANNKEAILD
jgi:DNA/RNA-binding domain of Phe-tRNA-synthetase-like protein